MSAGVRGIFGAEARRRAAQVMAERSQGRPPSSTNGHRPALSLDPAKLARFEPARHRLAETLARGGLSGRRPRVEKREILVVEDLAIHFGGVHALDGVALTARTAEIAGVIGPNGAGKTTTMRMLVGLLEPDGGHIRVAGEPMTTSSTAAKKFIGYVPQDLAIYPELSGRENLSFFAGLYGMPRGDIGARVDEILELVGAKRACR